MAQDTGSGTTASPARHRVSRTVLLGVWGLFLVGVLAAAALRSAPGAANDAAVSGAPASPAVIARGKYLVTIAGCNDCHTPLKMGSTGPEPDMNRMLSGHPEKPTLPDPPALPPDAAWNWAGSATSTAFSGPWGISYAINLTPDQNTGLGIWTEEMFIKAMRTGRHMGQSRPILPPMPWQAVAAMTDEDVKAVYAYLRSIPAIKNRVPDAVVAEPPPAPTGR